MNVLRKSPLFAVALGVLALVALGEGWYVVERVQAARKTQATLEQKRRELRSVAGVEPAPTAANAALIEADLARTDRALAQMQASLTGRGPAAVAMRSATVPERRADAYFDVAAFVEKMRDQAQRQGVALKADERFGFAEFANVGPEAELIAPVHHERLIAQFLLETLFAAHPRQLLSVQRERPQARTEIAPVGNRAGPRAGAASGPDFFEIDPRVSARVPGFVEATSFRLAFIGQTGALRAWLNTLAGFELPLVVRSVEVEPAGPAADAAVGEPAAPGAVTPLIRRTYSRFTVTVEFIDLVPPPS